MASKFARAADLVAVLMLRLSQSLSSTTVRRVPVRQILLKNTASISTSQEFIDDAGFFLQHTGKEQKEFGHGQVLYRLVQQRCLDLGANQSVNILEFGSARGFSSLVMARALEDVNAYGIVLSVDIVRQDTPSLLARGMGEDVRFSREEFLDHWREIVEKRIVFLCSSSSISSQVIQHTRFPLVFIDEHHTFANTQRDLNFASSRQRSGDVIILDDYTTAFPGVVRAVDEFVKARAYQIDIEENGPYRKMAVLTRVQ